MKKQTAPRVPAMLGTLPGSPVHEAHPAPSAMRFGSPPLWQKTPTLPLELHLGEEEDVAGE